MTHEELIAKIVGMCEELSLLVFYDPDTRRAIGPGFPDLFIAGPCGQLHREVKVGRDTLSDDQRAWGDVLVRGGADYDVWTPVNYRSGSIARELAAIA